MKKSLLYSITAMLLLVSPLGVEAKTSIKISNNGSSSYNSVSLKSSRSTRISQSNSDFNSNSIFVSQNTGSNKIKGNTGGSSSIKTGGIYSGIFISNIGGSNYLDHSDCCDSSCNDCGDHDWDHNHDCNNGGDCTEVPGWADDYMSVNQGTLANNDPITDSSRTDPHAVVGAADGNFFSLGKGGSIVVTFDRPVKNVSGDDLSFHEVTNDRGTYPEEKMMVEVSANGSTWYNIGEVSNNDGGDGVGYLDFDSTGLSSIQYVRMTDSTDYNLHDGLADGYDLDAIDATLLMCE